MRTKYSLLVLALLFSVVCHAGNAQGQTTGKTSLKHLVRANVANTAAPEAPAPIGVAPDANAGSRVAPGAAATSPPEIADGSKESESRAVTASASDATSDSRKPAQASLKAAATVYTYGAAHTFLRRAATGVLSDAASNGVGGYVPATIPVSSMLSASSATCFRHERETWNLRTPEGDASPLAANAAAVQDPPQSSPPIQAEPPMELEPGEPVEGGDEMSPYPPLPPVIISEFRFRGSMGALDEFVELYNNSDSPITVSTFDGSAGWAVVSLAPGENTGTTRFIIPNGTILPPRSYYLGTNDNRYSLSAYAQRDISYSNDIADGAGIALFRTAAPSNFVSQHRMDAVGFSTAPDSTYREGAGLTPICPGIMPNCVNISTPEHSFVRRLHTGYPQDTGDNAADFLFISVTGGTFNGVASKLGAPGPQNTLSPTVRSAATEVQSRLLDPSVPSSVAPNRERWGCSPTLPPCDPQTSAYGTLMIRRTFYNNTGAPITLLRFRVVDMTTYPVPSGTADLRLLSSPNEQITLSDGSVVQVRAMTRENPPAQRLGGGYNTTVKVGTITLSTPLAPGASVSLGFLNGVMQSGTFRFFINVEAANAPAQTGAAPTVYITDPPNGQIYIGPTNINVRANAQDSDGYVNKVEFYVADGSSPTGQTLIGSDDTPPYAVEWKNVSGNDYTLTAVAVDEDGNRTSSAPVQIHFTFGPPVTITPDAGECKVAKVVAFDQVFFYNRLGAFNPAGMIYALRRDIVPIDVHKGLVPGNVQLRADKRARPIALRMNVDECIRIEFQNLLAPYPKDDNQPATRTASVHVQGLQLVSSIIDDGSNVGNNMSGLVAPGGTATYTYYAGREGGHLLYSTAATTGGEGDGGSLAMGLFGSVNVEARGGEYYRSQVTAQEMRDATFKDRFGNPRRADTGQPLINYDARYPSGPFANTYILRIVDDNNEIIHSDLNAIITYQDRQPFPPGTYPPVRVEPNREQPFREFTVVYHDEIKAVQAFDEFEDPVLSHTLHSVRDGFAINYGTAGIGAEVLANRFGVGPMWNCAECLYEEFFLSSWTIGDPAQIVDVPANTRSEDGKLITGPKATKVLFPEDPSNVHHSYINDHVKFRVMHAGPKEHHIHHLHAHQWIHTPDFDQSDYLDSQAIGPGSTFTTEIAYNGTGNRNKVVGDSIFHCHFYPHFAMGMWELWRSHDVFEEGTVIDGNGVPVYGSRALPDGEISAGTPNPALVPLPKIAMAPMPEAQVSIKDGQVIVTGAGNPGYPYFVPALAGHRPPHPPLDTEFDGGLPRHIIRDGKFVEEHNRLSFDKHLTVALAQQIPEPGTKIEQYAMEYHAVRSHDSRTPENVPAKFITNGLPPKAGAPYADPCIDDNGLATGKDIEYRAAMFQFDIKLNKAGWHFPQQRIEALWQDVAPTRDGSRAPEPFFFRANTNHCIIFRHTNLVPEVYELDDFQVKTPTDVMGQHIHLVKFDVTSSDGAGNGWNYEDGSFSPGEVQNRINAINANGGMFDETGSTQFRLELKEHPFFGPGPDEDGDGTPDWLGAQITIQRWFADDVRDNENVDRTLRTVFTHDHFGPSTHQQAGEYAGLLVNLEGTRWRDPENRNIYYGEDPARIDGGPTSWRADIINERNDLESYREFALEFADFQLAYKEGGGLDERGRPAPDPDRAINPPGKKEADFKPPFVLLEKVERCPVEHGFEHLAPPPPCPEAISAADPGTMVVNYRNEPIPLRIWNFNGIGPEPGPHDNPPEQAPGDAGDLAYVYRSDITRVDQRFNVQPTFYPPLTKGVAQKDPFTPILRAYEDDRVQIKILVGAHEEGHNFTVNGIKWLFEPPRRIQETNPSGWRNSQMMGISEHFEFVVPVLPMPVEQPGDQKQFYDFRYAPGVASDDQWNGLWGILRAYRGKQPDGEEKPPDPRRSPGPPILIDPTDGSGGDTLAGSQTANAQTMDAQIAETQVAEDEALAPLEPLPSNPDGRAGDATETRNSLTGEPTTATVIPPVCPDGAPSPPPFRVSAFLARDLLPAQTLVYNPRQNQGGRLEDPTAIMYVRNSDIDLNTGKLKASQNVEPLILRAKAGDCITVILTNKIPAAIDLPGFNTMPMIIDNFNANQVKPSSKVGLHPQLLFYDVTVSDGMNVGFNAEINGVNRPQTADPFQTKTYTWYAGGIDTTSGSPVHVPIEFGATNLMPADPIKHSNKGAIGALIIEPQGSSITEGAQTTDGKNTWAVAQVTKSNGEAFREFVLLFQNDINMRFGNRRDEWGNLQAVPNLANEEDPEDSAQKAFNYRTEPFWKRIGYEPDLPLEETRQFDFTNVLSNAQVGGDPVTPVFTASLREYVRFRVLHPGGHPRNNAFQLHGHSWQEEPHNYNSSEIADNPVSEVKGTQHGVGPSSHFDIDLRIRAGGRFSVRGDYLIRDRASFQFDGGLWGIFRVQ